MSAQLALPHATPLLKAPPGHKHTRASICWHTHTCIADYRTASPHLCREPLVENTPLCYMHTCFCYRRSTPLFYSLKPFADAHEALPTHATPLLLKVPPCHEYTRFYLLLCARSLCRCPFPESPHLTLALPMPAPRYCHTRPCRNHVSLLCAHTLFPKSTPLVINTQLRTRLLACAHSLSRYAHRFTSTHTLVENTPFYSSKPICYRHSTVTLLLHSLKPLADVHTALLPHTRATPWLNAPPYTRTHSLP